jgi:hypothetical protein
MPEADGVPVSEMMGRPAEPWKMRSELDGKQVIPGRRPESGGVLGEDALKETGGLPPIVELPGSEPEPKRDAVTGRIEDAMVAPLRLRPKSEGVGQVLSSDDGVGARS